MLCYPSCKTIEFRFLRPTYNYHKITLWLYIFNAILMYAENMTRSIVSKDYRYIVRKLRVQYTGLFGILDTIYPTNLADRLKADLNTLKYIVINQESNRDYIGKEIDIEDKMLRPDVII